MYRAIPLHLDRSVEDVATLWLGLIPIRFVPDTEAKGKTHAWRIHSALTVSSAVYSLLRNVRSFQPLPKDSEGKA